MQSTEATNIHRCNHSFPATTSRPEHRCGSPALRGQDFCYYHHPTRQRVRNPNERRARRTARQTFNLPMPTSALQHQQSLCELMHKVSTNQIDPRRAGLLLFALQIAGQHFS